MKLCVNIWLEIVKSLCVYMSLKCTIFYLICEALCQEGSNPKKRGKICKLCALIKLRIVKSFRSGSFVLC
jgi:hypothetical protein